MDLRIGNVERLTLTESLSQARAEGYLDSVEFEHRLEIVQKSVTRSQACVVLGDLPSRFTPTAPRPQQPRPYSVPPFTYQESDRFGFAFGSLVSSLLGAVLFWIPFLGAFLGALAMALGLISTSDHRKAQSEQTGSAAWGLGLGFAAFLGGVIMTVYIVT